MVVHVKRSAAEFRAACDHVRQNGGRIALVPTMGALHHGHRVLIRDAARRASHVAVTIFVNPTQFGPNEDFERYPRTLEADIEACEAEGASLVFAPSVAEMYSPGETTRVRVSELTEELCGRTRPGHFEGVTTIVAKLFAVTGPAIAIFGRKDYQQLKVIERMTRDLLLPIEIVGHPTVREPDGLALSSRNGYLSAADRVRALAIPRGLSEAVRSYAAGERKVGALRLLVERAIGDAGLVADYVTVADPERIKPLGDAASIGPTDRALLAVAAYAGRARLIDNVVLGEDSAPIVA